MKNRIIFLRHFLVSLILILIASFHLQAQQISKTAKTFSQRNGLELGLAGAALGFAQLNYARVLARSTNNLDRSLVISLSSVPGSNREDEGRFIDVSLWVGYRHYIWKGLNVELGMVHSYANVTQNPEIPNRTFNSYGLSNYGLLGYQLDFARNKPISYYVNIRPLGFYFQWIESDIWPGQDDNRGPYLALDVGIKF